MDSIYDDNFSNNNNQEIIDLLDSYSKTCDTSQPKFTDLLMMENVSRAQGVEPPDQHLQEILREKCRLEQQVAYLMNYNTQQQQFIQVLLSQLNEFSIENHQNNISHHSTFSFEGTSPVRTTTTTIVESSPKTPSPQQQSQQQRNNRKRIIPSEWPSQQSPKSAVSSNNELTFIVENGSKRRRLTFTQPQHLDMELTSTPEVTFVQHDGSEIQSWIHQYQQGKTKQKRKYVRRGCNSSHKNQTVRHQQ